MFISMTRTSMIMRLQKKKNPVEIFIITFFSALKNRTLTLS